MIWNVKWRWSIVPTNVEQIYVYLFVGNYKWKISVHSLNNYDVCLLWRTLQTNCLSFAKIKRPTQSHRNKLPFIRWSRLVFCGNIWVGATRCGNVKWKLNRGVDGCYDDSLNDVKQVLLRWVNCLACWLIVIEMASRHYVQLIVGSASVSQVSLIMC